MTSPRCETCPWWTLLATSDGGAPIGACHHIEYTPNPDGATKESGNWWCSLHPDAPQPVYEVECLSHRDVPQGDGWEPWRTIVDPIHASGHIYWRRITGYTKGGSDD